MSAPAGEMGARGAPRGVPVRMQSFTGLKPAGRTPSAAGGLYSTTRRREDLALLLRLPSWCRSIRCFLTPQAHMTRCRGASGPTRCSSTSWPAHAPLLRLLAPPSPASPA